MFRQLQREFREIFELTLRQTALGQRQCFGKGKVRSVRYYF